MTTKFHQCLSTKSQVKTNVPEKYQKFENSGL